MSGFEDKVEGQVKQAAGKLTDDKGLEMKGKLQELTGKVEEKLKEAGDKVAETVHNHEHKE